MFLKRVYYLYMINLKIMLSFPKVVIIDELSINEDNRSRIMSGVTSELEETLAWLADNTAMTLAALSSTSLLDRHTDAVSETVSDKELDEMIKRTGFIESVQLKFIMRSSQNIAAATSPASVNQALYTGRYMIQETISSGASSTVPGTRPRAWVYKYTADVDYTKLAGFVTQHLRTVDTERLKCVVLTGWDISARMLCSKMNTPVSLYDGSVTHGVVDRHTKSMQLFDIRSLTSIDYMQVLVYLYLYFRRCIPRVSQKQLS